MLLVVVLALFVYFGGSMVPSVLRKNKVLLLGVAVGLVLCSFMGLQLEGFKTQDECLSACSKDHTVVEMRSGAAVKTRPPKSQMSNIESEAQMANMFASPLPKSLPTLPTLPTLPSVSGGG